VAAGVAASAPVEVVVAEGVAVEVVVEEAGLERLNRPTRHISMPHSLNRSRLQHPQVCAHRLFRGVRPRHPLRLRPHRMLQLQPMRFGSCPFPHSPSEKIPAQPTLAVYRASFSPLDVLISDKIQPSPILHNETVQT
jgi:hypothetical protein